MRNELALNESVEFRIYTGQCPTTDTDTNAVDMYGISPWERVPDFLYAHGLCSYRNWYEYNRSIATSATSRSRTQTCLNLGSSMPSSSVPGYCELSGNEDSWVFTLDEDRASTKGMYRQKVLYQHAHTCDRDYMHLAGMQSCMTIPSKVHWKEDRVGILQEPSITNSLKQANWLRFHQPNGYLRIASMLGPSVNPKFGFLGRPLTAPPSVLFNSYADFGFQRCKDKMQCYEQDFFVYGYIVPRRLRKAETAASSLLGIPYSFGDQFECGGFGYKDLDDNKCKLDLGVATMYRVLCFSQASRRAILDACKGNLIKGDQTETSLVNEFCQPFATQPFAATEFAQDGFVPSWPLGRKDSEIKAIADKLNLLSKPPNLWSPFSGSTSSEVPTAEQYTKGVTCANVLYAEVEKTAITNAPVYTLETRISPEDGREIATKLQHGGMSMYMFSLFGMYEYPLSWFYKCTLQAGRVADAASSVFCAEWKDQVDPSLPDSFLKAAKSTSPLDTWYYLKTLNSGLSYAQYWADRDITKAQWDAKLASVYGNISQGLYYDNYDANQKLARTCATRREISRYFAYESEVFVQELKRSLFLNFAGDIWPSNFGPNDKCYGALPQTGLEDNTNITSLPPPCTVGLDRVYRASDANELRTAVLNYFKQDAVERFDFIKSAGSLSNSMQAMSQGIPVARYNNIDVIGGKLVMLEDRLRRMTLTSVFDTNCMLQLLSSAKDKECFYKSDDSIPLFEKQNPQYKDLQKKKPYVVAAWGTDIQPGNTGTWPLVEKLYDGRAPQGISADIAESLIITPSDISDSEKTAFAMPNLAVGVMNVGTASKLTQNLHRITEHQGFYGIDAFCGLYEGTTRSDPCFGPLAPKMGGGPNACPNSQININPEDVNEGHTCVPQSMCMWKNHPDKALDMDVWKTGYWMSTRTGRYNEWFTANYVRHIWKFTMDPRHVTELFLPVGVFLETFQPQIAEVDCSGAGCRQYNPLVVLMSFKDPAGTGFLDEGMDIGPLREWGMWPMCPHLYNEDNRFYGYEKDSFKSMMLEMDDVIAIPPKPFATTFAGYSDRLLPYQTNFAQGLSYSSVPSMSTNNLVVGTKQLCKHSDIGIKKCTVTGGYLNFRIGLAPGYVINAAKCPALSYAYPVMGSIKRCVTCTWWTPQYCSGMHECRFHVVSSQGRISNWRSLRFVPAAIIEAIQAGDGLASVLEAPPQGNVNTTAPIWPSKRMSEATAIKSLVALVGNFLLEEYKEVNKKYIPMPVAGMPLYNADKDNWNKAKKFEEYNPSAMVTYENQLPPLANPSTDPSNSRCSGKKVIKGKNETVFKIDYKACNFSSQYEQLARTVGNQSTTSDSPFRVKEGIIIPPLTRIAYLTSKSMMISHGLPSWSLNTRAAGDIFVQNLLNASAQCSHANVRDAICSFNNDQLYLMNPW